MDWVGWDVGKVRMLARTRLAESGGLFPRRLMQGLCKSLAIPVAIAGVLCVSAPFVYGAVDRIVYAAVGRTATPCTTVPVTITVPQLTQSTSTGSVGHVRMINHAIAAGTVGIVACDDTGQRYGPATLDTGAGKAVQLDADGLEDGNAAKGLQHATGAEKGLGGWNAPVPSASSVDMG